MHEHGVVIIGVEVGNMITANISGTAFTAVSTKVINRTDKELSEEKIFASNNSLSNTNNSSSNRLKINQPNEIIPKNIQKEKTEELYNISYHTSSKLQNSSLVAFTDQSNGKYVVLSLKNDTISMLKSHFGNDDLYKRDDGITRLDNKAEAYVAGWFADIAYKREFLSSDSNNDGLLSDGEYRNTKNSFSHHGDVFGAGDNIEINTWIGDTYQKSSSSAKNFINQIQDKANITIDKQLDITINNDDDFNSKISFDEALTTHYGKNTKDSIIQLAKDMVGLPKQLEDAMLMEKIEKINEKNQEKLNALIKAFSSGGEFDTLTDTEKSLLEEEFSVIQQTNQEIMKHLSNKIDELQKINKYKENQQF